MAKPADMENSKSFDAKEDTCLSSFVCSSLGESYEFGNNEEEVKKRLHEISKHVGLKAYEERKNKLYGDETARRRKKYVTFDLNFLKDMDQQEIYNDIEKIRNVMGGQDFKAKIENKVLQTLQGNFKKNDRVRLMHENREDIVVISWINTNEITFRGKDGERIKYSLDYFLEGRAKIYKARKSME